MSHCPVLPTTVMLIPVAQSDYKYVAAFCSALDVETQA